MHRKTYCWFCGSELRWLGDFSFEDYGYENEGIVAELSCPNCGANAEFSLRLDEENEDI